MKILIRVGLFAIKLFFTFFCIAQNAFNTNLVSNIFVNPANVNIDTNARAKLHLFSFTAWAGGSKSAFNLKDAVRINQAFIRDKLLGNQYVASGWGGVSLNGPGILVPIKKKFAIGITTRKRFFANYWDIDGKLISEIEEVSKVRHEYPYNVARGNMQLNTKAWSDLGLSFSAVLFNSENSILKAGFTAHYLAGLSHASINASVDSGVVRDFGGGLPYLTSSTGTISTLTSGSLYNDFSFKKMFSDGKASVGLDLGLVYEYKNKSVNGISFKVGASVTDIGKIRFMPDSSYSRDYDMEVSSSRFLFFTQNFPNTPFNHLTIPIQANPGYFKETGVSTKQYSTSLPTTLHLDASINFNRYFFVNSSFSMGITPRKDINKSYSLTQFQLSPGFENRKMTIQLPVNLQSYTGVNAGLFFKVGSFFLGSNSLFTSALGNRQLDGYAGLEVHLKSGDSKKAVILSNSAKTKNIQQLENIDTTGITARNKKTVSAQIELQAIGTSNLPNNTVPFWMRANKYGSVPLSGISTSVIARVGREYDSARRKKAFDWGGGIEARLNAGKDIKGILSEAYAKVRVSVFELKGGRSKDVIGLLADTALSSGAFAISGNALGVPKISLSLPQYTNFPFKNGLIAFKGHIAHGWLGEIPLRPRTTTLPKSDIYFHELSLYGRVGKPNWKIKFYGGVNHEVFWGNERKFIRGFELSDLETYFYVATGKVYQNSKVGNHLGTVDLGLEYSFDNFKIIAVRQNFYEAGALWHFANIMDGLNGLCFKNTKSKLGDIYWKKLLIEVLYTKNQAGELNSKPTNSGDEDYYHNANYVTGWSYKGLGLGTPFITQKFEAQSNLPSNAADHFINNRVLAFHAGFEGGINDLKLMLKLSYSKNFGIYGTSPIGHSLGSTPREISPPPYFQTVNQFSLYAGASKQIKKKLYVHFELAADAGKLLYNSIGGSLGVRYNLLSGE